jgi:Protein of unknown function (DUF1593)/Domain of unknown function (DUF5060)
MITRRSHTVNNLILIAYLFLYSTALVAQHPTPNKPRIIISTDIGGTDPDDNQSMAHLLMYSERFHIEGLISSPSYGAGNKEEIWRMIGLYEKDLPKLKKHQKGFPSPAYLRSVTKQGRHGGAPYIGYSTATEGSNWIIERAKTKSKQPLWILVWGGLDDLAQTLHDAPEIQNTIKVYWIGGPNKKWSVNSYAYIAENFPNLFFIEVNASYYGFFSHNNAPDSVKKSDYYDRHINASGHLGRDFKNYYNGEVKMGDTPSLLYMMDGNPNEPTRESWGGSFEKIEHSTHVIFDRTTDLTDTVSFCTVVEFHLSGPAINAAPGAVCFWMEVGFKNSVQKWPGYYLGNGRYVIKYAPKQAEILNYRFTSDIPGFDFPEGKLVVNNLWPGKSHTTDYQLGSNWYSDKAAPNFFDGNIQGGKTILKWRNDILLDWAERWVWLR